MRLMSDIEQGGHERYELEDLFPGASRETLSLLRLAGLALLIILMALALAYPFAWLGAV